MAAKDGAMSAAGALDAGRRARDVTLRGRLRPRSVAAFGAGFGGALGLALANGGYFPTSWSWAALALAFAAALALLRPLELPRRAGLVFAGGLAALLAWTAASVVWSPSLTRTVLEVQRGALYVALAACLILLLRAADVPNLVAGLLAGIATASGYGLATRLFPEQLGSFDAVATYRLAEPFGYWNALGIVAAIGLVLALGVAARAGSAARRGAAAATVPLLACTLYFTFSRGAWLALALGLAVAVGLDRRRLQLLATGTCALLPAAAATALAWRSPALVREDAVITAASSQGQRLALAILIASGAAAALTVLAATLQPRVSLGRRGRYAIAGVLAAVAVATVSIGLVRAGGPVGVVERAAGSFTHSSAQVDVELNDRLFTLSANGRAEYWGVALDVVADNPMLGVGAGGYERRWLEERAGPGKVRDAHSLYLEVLAELGPLGLGLVLLALGAPLVAGVRARSSPLAATLTGAYAAFLLHAAVDWDWEMAAVTAVGLACGAALCVLGQPAVARTMPVGVRGGALAAAICIGGFSLVAATGAAALAHSRAEAAAGNFEEAEVAARHAATVAPWSSQPLAALGEAQLARGDVDAARATFERALALDREDWSLWLDLARTAEGSTQKAALAHASALNPHSPEIAQLRAELELEAGAAELTLEVGK
jgi:Flp pilus assembly protein TadD